MRSRVKSIAAILRRPRELVSILRFTRHGLVLLGLDIVAICVSAVGALALRFDWAIPGEYIPRILVFVALALPIKVGFLRYFRLYRLDWRFVGAYELLSVASACFFSMLALGAVSFLVFTRATLPRSIVVIDFVLTLMAIGAIRAWPRAMRAVRGSDGDGRRSVLVVGAGEAGASLVRDLKNSQSHTLRVVGFIDDDTTKRGTFIHGVEVLGPRAILPTVVGSQRIEEVLIAMPSASPNVIQETVADLRSSGIQDLRIVPDLDAVLSGRITASNVREVRVEDLLNRRPPVLDAERLAAALGSSDVVVTGAAGSIGSELARHLARLPIQRLILFDQNESGLFDLERELRRLSSPIGVVSVVGNVTDAVKVDEVFASFNPTVVFHAAAYKHVPLMESHPREAVMTNVLGTWTMAKAAARGGSRTFVLISTDKAVNPTSVMGATKRLAELMVATLFRSSTTRFIALRFGNVLGSRGSLVPVLQDQIRNGGPITITDPEMERYFMTSSEAVFLILGALLEGEPSDILVLEMGEPIRLLDLATAVARLSGIEPDRDIPITFVGSRPGEKDREELVGRDEQVEPTAHPMIRRVRGGNPTDPKGLEEGLLRLQHHCSSGFNDEIGRTLERLVPTYARRTAGLSEAMLEESNVVIESTLESGATA